MFTLPYQTTPCQAYVLTEIEKALQHAAIDGQLVTARTGKNVPVVGLFEVPPNNKAVLPFAHPLYIEQSGKPLFVVDTRPYTREDRFNSAIVVTHRNDYDFCVLYGRLTKAWAQGHALDFRTFGDILPIVYVRMLSMNIVRRLGLDPLAHQTISAVTAYYYFCQFESGAITEDQALAVATRISRVTRISASTVLTVLDSLRGENEFYPVLHTIDSYVKALQQAVHTPRMAQLNVALVYASLAGMWYGSTAREYIAVALEYPPLWVALIYTALTDRTYHGAMLSRLVQESDKHSIGADFVRSLATYLEHTAHA